MDRKTLLDDFRSRLSNAAFSSNWRVLKATDRELAAFLLTLNPRRGWTQAEWASFLALKRTHAEIREHCRRESALYAARIASMRQTKIGWMAYAMHGGQRT